VLLGWACFYLALSSADLSNDPGYEPPPTSLALGHPNGQSSAHRATALAAEDGSILETECKTFSFADLNMSGLEALLREYFDLELLYPDSARSFNLTAIERGGAPLGEILAGLLAPHNLAFSSQGKTIQVIAAKVERRNDSHTSAGLYDFQTTIEGKWAVPIDVWIDSFRPIRLHIEAQPLFGESEAKHVNLTIEGTRVGRVVLRHVLSVPLGQAARIDVSGGDLLWLAVRPVTYNETHITLEVQFHHETTLAS